MSRLHRLLRQALLMQMASAHREAYPSQAIPHHDAAQVSGEPTGGREISHWLKYHQAAYRNASDLGSPAVQRHEAHFQHVIDGELKETRYYQGRMSRAQASGHGER